MRYYVDSYGETAEDAEALKDTNHIDDPAYFATLAAEHIHSNRDGWESSWPMTIVVIDNDHVEHKFIVEREFNPQFYAYRKKDE